MELTCEFETKHWYNGNIYTCKNTSVVITKRKAKIKAIIGVHHDQKTDEDVEAIEFIGAIVQFFPRDLIKIFPNLRYLSIYNCGLKKITYKDLLGLENLQELWLKYNQLTELPNNLFINMHNLKMISFSNNKLNRISSKLLDPLLSNGLSWVDFRRNARIDSTYCNIPSFKSSARSLGQLMKTIDEKCLKPTDIETAPNEKETFMQSFTKGFAELWISGRFSDFVLVVEKKEFRVHKNVLGIHSPVFAEIFEKDAEEARTNRINIEGLSAEAVEQFLRYVYTGQVDDEADSIRLFTIAVKFNVPALKSICEENILDDLDESNALEVYNLGHRHSSKILKQAAFNEIEKMFPDKNLPEDLINQRQRLLELVELKNKTDLLLNCLQTTTNK